MSSLSSDIHSNVERLQIQVDVLDCDYLNRWAKELEVSDLFEKALQETA
jgi:hypothetical protein